MQQPFGGLPEQKKLMVRKESSENKHGIFVIVKSDSKRVMDAGLIG